MSASFAGLGVLYYLQLLPMARINRVPHHGNGRGWFSWSSTSQDAKKLDNFSGPRWQTPGFRWSRVGSGAQMAPRVGNGILRLESWSSTSQDAQKLDNFSGPRWQTPGFRWSRVGSGAQMAPRVGNGIPRLDSMTWYQPWGFSHKSKMSKRQNGLQDRSRFWAGFNWFGLVCTQRRGEGWQ